MISEALRDISHSRRSELSLGNQARIKIAAMGVGAALLFSGAPSEVNQPGFEKNQAVPAIPSPSTPNTELRRAIPVPCWHPLPWEAPINRTDKPSGLIGEVKLASIKLPEPTPDPNQPECWIIIDITSKETRSSSS